MSSEGRQRLEFVATGVVVALLVGLWLFSSYREQGQRDCDGAQRSVTGAFDQMQAQLDAEDPIVRLTKANQIIVDNPSCFSDELVQLAREVLAVIPAASDG